VQLGDRDPDLVAAHGADADAIGALYELQRRGRYLLLGRLGRAPASHAAYDPTLDRRSH
jgi:hypothetical protein